MLPPHTLIEIALNRARIWITLHAEVPGAAVPQEYGTLVLLQPRTGSNALNQASFPVVKRRLVMFQ